MSSQTADSRPTSWLGRWFDSHPQRIVGLVLGFGFLLRLRAAWGTFLNPDEALHFLTGNGSSWLVAYQASLDTAHPPLLFLVLHLWRHLGTLADPNPRACGGLDRPAARDFPAAHDRVVGGGTAVCAAAVLLDDCGVPIRTRTFCRFRQAYGTLLFLPVPCPAQPLLRNFIRRRARRLWPAPPRPPPFFGGAERCLGRWPSRRGRRRLR